MSRDWRRVEELERRYQREALRDVDYPAALRRFAALWAEALLVNPDIGADWLHDLKPDFAVARAINGLPPISADELEDLASVPGRENLPKQIERLRGAGRRRGK